jgi:hypothetical protein
LPELRDPDFIRAKKMTRVSSKIILFKLLVSEDGSDRFIDIRINKNWSLIEVSGEAQVEVTI